MGRAVVTRNAAGVAVAAVALLCGGAVPGSASAAPTIDEYTAGNAAYHEPLSIVSAQGEKLWFTVKSPPGFGEASLAKGAIEKFSKYELVGREPREVIDGPGGDLWATVDGGLTPGLIWGSGGTFNESLTRLAGKPVGIANGPEGDIWFTEQTGSPKIVQYDPSTGKIVGEFSEGLESGGKPAQIVAGSDEDLWFAEQGGHSAIDRIEPGTGKITRFPAAVSSSEPGGLALGPEGDIWFTEIHAGKIGRITPSGEKTEFEEGLTQGEPIGIAAADDGDLYFTERGHEGAVGQITPKGTITEFRTGLTKNNEPWAITTGADGNVWFTEVHEAKIGKLTIPPGIAATSAGTPGETEAELKAEVLANAQSSTLAFEYGPTGVYGATSSPVGVGAGTTASAGSADLTGLEPDTTYHFRALANNASGTTYGPDKTFTTAAAPPAEPPAEEEPPSEGSGGGGSSGEGSGGGEAPAGGAPEGGPGSKEPAAPPEAPAGENGQTENRTDTTNNSPAPNGAGEVPAGPFSALVSPLLARTANAAPAPPAIGRSGVVGVVSGTVFVRNPDTGLEEPLGPAADLPVGVPIDARDGVVALTTALPGGHMQTADVWGGIFRFVQAEHGDGRTQLYLSGTVGPCPVRGRAARANRVSVRGRAAAGPKSAASMSALATAAHARARRQLWSKDSHGKYTTHGANSAATVLGTEWLTVDSCAGTLTRVRRGRVRVRDRHNGRVTVLGAGHSYLARS